MLAIIYRIETIDGTAVVDEDYKQMKEELVFEANEAEKTVYVEIVNDNQWEPDETFFMKIIIDPEYSNEVIMGRISIMEITILNDDGRLESASIIS